MQKGFSIIFIILGVLVLVIVSGGAYFLGKQSNQPPQENISNNKSEGQNSPSSLLIDETANWQIYEEKKNGYSIKYPSDKFVRLKCPEYKKDDFILIKREQAQTQLREAGDMDAVEVSSDMCILDGRYGFEITTQLFPEPEGSSFTKEEILIGGVKGQKYIVEYKPGDPEFESPYSKWRTEIFVNKGKKYNIYYSDKSLTLLYDQIISTFKFEDQTSQMFATEGQNCGKNAGAGGDAQCETGLRCFYKDAQEEQTGIGTCIK